MAVATQVREVEADTDRKRREEMIRRWLEAKELYEKYPRVVKTITEGKHLQEYQRAIERIAEETQRRRRHE